MLKIASWNINSVRARTERLLRWLSAHQPDVLCLQELKCEEGQFPFSEIAALGYQAQVFGQKTYNGVGILSKITPTDVHKGLNDGVEDTHSRYIAASFGDVRVVNVYAPNGQEVNSPAYQYKLRWYDRLTKLLHSQSPRQWVVCGDFNIAPGDIDVYDPKTFAGQTLFSEPERIALERLMADIQLVDLFRVRHPDRQQFSWWDYRSLGFPLNRGLRIDHLLVSQSLADRCDAVDIDRDERKGSKPSDHAPIWAVFR